MLKTNFPTELGAISLGIGTPTLEAQVKAMGMQLPNAELWEQRHTALNLLRVGGFLTELEILRIGKRLVRALGQDVHFAVAVTDLAREVASVLPEKPAPEGGADPVTDGEQDPAGGQLDAYLGDGVVGE